MTFIPSTVKIEKTVRFYANDNQNIALILMNQMLYKKENWVENREVEDTPTGLAHSGFSSLVQSLLYKDTLLRTYCTGDTWEGPELNEILRTAPVRLFLK